MADDDAGAVVGAFLLFCLVALAVVTAVLVIVIAGSVIGTGVGLVNYFKSFRANVRLERPVPP